jgi:hypothetical protein
MAILALPIPGELPGDAPQQMAGQMGNLDPGKD